jgi:hypothetical protein
MNTQIGALRRVSSEGGVAISTIELRWTSASSKSVATFPFSVGIFCPPPKARRNFRQAV